MKKKKINSNMKLNEQISKIKRLLNNPTVFPEKKEIIQEAAGSPWFDVAVFLEKLAVKFVPIENKIARTIISDLEHQRVNALEFDAGKGIIKSVNFANMNEAQLTEFFRIPQVREVLEQMAKEYRPMGPSGPVVPFVLTNRSLARLYPNSLPAKIINAYQASANNVAKLTNVAKYIKIPFNRWVNKYWVGGKILTWFTDKVKYDIFIRGVQDDFNNSKYIEFYKKMYDKAAKIGSDYLQAKNTDAITSYKIYEEEIQKLLKEFQLMRNNVKKEVFTKMRERMPEEIVKDLDAAAAHENASDFNKMWGELKKVSDAAVTEEEKYTYYLTGIIRGFSELGSLKFVNPAKRLFNWLIRFDARLNSEIVNNVKSKGRFGWAWREVLLRTAILALYYGLVDYAEAYYKNVNGKAFEWPKWMPKYLGWAGVDDKPWEPDIEWGNKIDGKARKSILNGGPYLFVHMYEEASLVFKTHPLNSITKTGPVTDWLIDIMSDPEKQKQLPIIETKLYQDGKNALIKKISEDQRYKTLSPDEQQSLITDSLNAYDVHMQEMRESRSTNKQLID